LSGSLLDLSTFEIPDLAAQLIGLYLFNVQQLGQSTAELHCALASGAESPDFTPQPFSSLYQRSLYQQSRNLTGRVFISLKERLDTLPSTIQLMAQAALDRHEESLERFRLMITHRITAQRIRCHGDYQLEQLLYTGKDFTVLNFEGDGRSLSGRCIKRSPLRDIASMLLSFHEASRVALAHQIETSRIRPETLPLTEQWTEFWVSWVSAAFLKHYLATAQPDRFLPQTHAEMAVLLEACLLEKAIINLGDCLSDPPDRAQIWLQRLLQF
ncbi:MAG: alpha-amylase, partial [Phormidesmis sp. CAN_BIN36]|nr:alpha-amylase [Phormidesmis sp. CAN_BIN36]